ncbi:MAG: hypothetical protein ACTSYM_04295 [Candidatus Baldrarchaeia archaeon]
MVSLLTCFGWIANTYLTMHMPTFMLGGYERNMWGSAYIGVGKPM